jgi:hypothetical protein
VIKAVYLKNHTKLVNVLCGLDAELQDVKEGGTYSYRWTLKGLFKLNAGISPCNMLPSTLTV